MDQTSKNQLDVLRQGVLPGLHLCLHVWIDPTMFYASNGIRLQATLLNNTLHDGYTRIHGLT